MTMNDFYFAREQSLGSSVTNPKRVQRNIAKALVLVLMLSPILVMGAPAFASHPLLLTVELSPPTDTNVVGTSHTVTATVEHFDGGFEATSDTVVEFSVTGTAGESPTTATATTDANGVATFTFSSTRTGVSDITAEVPEATAPTSDTAQKTWTAGPAQSLTLVPQDATNDVGEDHDVTATVRDQFENGVPGVTVSFSATGTGAETPPTATEVSDDDGEAVYTFTSTRPGVSNITATAGSTLTDTAEKEWLGSDQVTLDPQEDVNPAGTSHTVVATIRDQHGDVVTGETRTVTFTASGTGAETPNSATATTVNGRATFTFTSTRTGTSVITATVETAGGTRSDTALKHWVCGPIDGPDFAFDIARDLVMLDDCSGYLLDGYGAVHAFGGATETVSGTLPYFPGFDIAREVVLVRNQTGTATGGYVLDGWGGLHPFAIVGGATPPQAAADKPYFAGNDIARDVVLTGLNQTTGRYGGYMLDGRAGVHGFGGNSGLAGAPYFSFDIARELVFFTGEENSGNGYILDGWGGMHPLGNKGPLSGLPYFPGNDIANDALLSSPNSGYMLDGYGGIHPFGANEIPASTGPYTFGADTYRAFDLPSTRQGLLLDNQGGLWEWFPQ